jgi:hypothetical protein
VPDYPPEKRNNSLFHINIYAISPAYPRAELYMFCGTHCGTTQQATITARNGSHSTEPRHAKITTKPVTGLQPEAAQYEVTDTELPGFRVRVMPSGVKTSSVVYRTHDGWRRRYSLGRLWCADGKAGTECRHGSTGSGQGRAKPGEDPQAAKKAAQQSVKMSTLEEVAGEEGDYGRWVAARHKSEIVSLHRPRAALKEFGATRLDRIPPGTSRSGGRSD